MSRPSTDRDAVEREYAEMLRGVDIHGGLRIRLEYQPSDRSIRARYSAEPGTDVVAHVEKYIATLTQRLGYTEQWLRVFTGDERRPENGEST